jgi:Kef-type K+ transport system membrane component KefB
MITGYVIELIEHAQISELTILFQVGLMIVFAGVLAFIFKLLRQPRIPAYVVAGIILGPLALGLIESNETILALSEIGVAFLLFFAGLEIHLSSLKQVGKPATFIGLFEVGIMAVVAFFIFKSFSIGNLQLLYVSLVIAFSSTMVVIKSLSDKDQLGTLHGRIIVGILLIQDIVAISVLSVLSDSLSVNSILISLGKASLFIFLAVIVAKGSKPIFKASAKSHELILIISLAFLFLFSLGAYSFGLSIAIGAFFAGVALANSTFKTEIKGLVHPLRDFFGAILFVSLGIQLMWIPQSQWLFFGILIFLIMVIKPILIFSLTRILGYTDRTSFLTGNYMGQSSEFALILLTQGFLIGHLTNEFFSVLVFSTIVTMSITGYFVSFEKGMYKGYSKLSRVFRKIPYKKEKLLGYGGGMKKKKIVLFGAHRMGSMFLKEYKGNKDEILVVDFNPEIIQYLTKKKIPCVYGDYGNPEIFEMLRILSPEVVISTIPSKEENLNIIKMVKEDGRNDRVIVVSESIHDAIDLYEHGADYVMIPKVISGGSLLGVIRKLKKEGKSLKRKEVSQLKKARNFVHKKK